MATFETVGTRFLVGQQGSPASPLDYAEFCVTSLDPVGSARTLIDVTTLCSTAREYKLALKDGQEISVEAFYDPDDTVQAQLRTALDNGTELPFKIILSDGSPGTEISFDALVMGWNIGAAIDNVYPLRVTLKPTGPILFA
jgi:hypothetical protein